MTYTLLQLFDLIGTIAFAISGAFVGIRHRMDIFGVLMLAITTACGGGLMRDLVIGSTPPLAFRNPFYVGVAALTGLSVFLLLYLHQRMPKVVAKVYDQILFWFDTLGLAAFTVDGVIIGANAGFSDEPFLLCFLGFITGVGGGALRDVLANRMPDIFLKKVYAIASIAGAVSMTLLYRVSNSWHVPMIVGSAVVVIVRYLAKRFLWNLPRIEEESGKRD